MELLNKREIKILHLLSNSKEMHTGQEIALLLNVSSRTVRNDIKNLNALLPKYHAEIISHKGKGYELIIREEDKIRFCISDFLFQDEKFELLDDLFPNTFLDVDSLKNIILDQLIQHQLRLTDDAIKNLIIHIIITVWRIQNHKESIVSKEMQSAMEHTREFAVAHFNIKSII